MIIEAARDANDKMPASKFIDDLLTGSGRFMLYKKKRGGWAANLALMFEEFAELGRLEIPRQQNYIRGDLWEVKTSELRFPYYEGNDLVHGRYVRLTHGFIKQFGKTADGKMTRGDINYGLKMIEEDRAS